MKEKIVVTIPAYNEASNIADVLKEIRAVMNLHKYNFEILVVDDGSVDDTSKIARKYARVVVQSRNYGLAETFRMEMDECIKMGADIIVHTDADGQYPAKYIPDMIKKVMQGNDLVLGSRFEKGNYSGSLLNKLGNIAFAKVLTNLLRIKLTDTTTGFRAFRRNVAKLPIINRFTYTQEQLIRAGKSHLRIAEVHINTRGTRKSKLFKNPFDYAIKAWINIMRIYRDYEPLTFFGRIGAIFIILGFFAGLIVLYNYIITGINVRLGLSLISALFIISGVQIVLFGFLADMNRYERI
jgi:glycosyltransferase involved in cell wall biosynthesis